MPATGDVRNHHTRLVLVSLAAFVALAVLHTWPLAADPGHFARTDNADASLNIWAVSWVGTHLFTDPAHVFDANIFYPERRTLAYSEAMLLQGVVAAPVLALGGSPVLAFNVALLAGFVLTGWAFCLLVQRWTGSWAAGFVSGSLAAFNAHVLVRMGHLQTMHPEFFAVMLYALDRFVASPRFKNASLLSIGFVLQALTSIYLLVFSVWTLLFAFLARVDEWIRNTGRVLAMAAVAAVIAAALLWPELSVYVQLRSETGMARSAADQLAGSWWQYLATGARLHRWWVPPEAASSGSYAFPGVLAIVLIICALAQRDTRADPRVRMCAITAAGCLAVSMAPRLPFYPALHQLMPLFQAVRVPAHLSQEVLLMIAVLAGFGVIAVGRRWPRLAAWPAGVALVLIVNIEALRAPVGYVRFEGIPAVFESLAAERGAVVVELPFPIPQQWFLNASYMLNSTKHWRPMPNGYSGFRPASYERWYEAARGFPNEESLIALHGLGVTHMIVHTGAIGADRTEALARVQSLQQIASEGDILIFRFRAR
jgi:hypothetical protein